MSSDTHRWPASSIVYQFRRRSQPRSSGQSIMSTSTSSVERVQEDTDVHVPPRFNGTTASKDYYVNVGQRASGSRTWRLVEVIARDGTSTSKARKGEEEV